MERKNGTEELLRAVHENVTTGSETLGCMIPMIRNKFMMTEATRQMESYAAFTKETASMMAHHGLVPEKMSAGRRLMTRAGVMMETLFDTTEAHLAEMIVRGNRRGSDALFGTMSGLAGAESDVLSLAREVAEFERREAERMMDFT